MTTASPNSRDESIESSDARFQSALEYYSGGENPALADTPRAQSILWVDQTRHLFVCDECKREMAALQWTGDTTRDDYDDHRAEMYEKLLHTDPECDVCAVENFDALGIGEVFDL